MRITFISNYFSHHQKGISDALNKLAQYTFVSTKEMDLERNSLGWSKCKQDYICNNFTYNSGIERDVIIIGSAPKTLTQNIIKSNKLIFRYSERPLKKGLEPIKIFPRLIKWHIQNPMSKPIYMLCASAYTALDYSKFGLFKNRTYKWGYFPETKHYPYIDELINDKENTEILWCGRFLDWKHPDDAIMVVNKLKKDGYSVSLKLIGTGVMESHLKKMVKELDLESNITFTGPMSPEKVRENMERAGIYIFTSDRQEGWGAVLNESMNSGCAVVASHLIGSVPYLIDNTVNGFIYESGNVDMLYEKVKYLLDNPEKQKELGKQAYKTITEEWNAEIAAERFINLAQEILNGNKYPDLYESGPCSKAEIVKEDWQQYL